MTGRAILVIGDSMLDRYWDGLVERISPEAPVPVLKFAKEWQRPGGAANVAANICAMGSQATLATLVGEDEAGDLLLQLMATYGVKLKAVRSPHAVTTQKIRAVCGQHQMLRIDIEREVPTQALESLIQTADALIPRHPWILLSDYHKGSLSRCEGFIQSARQCGSRVLVDPKGSDFERYRGAWLLKPNEKEARAMTGAWSSEAEFTHLMHTARAQFGVEHLLVTRGERGMSLFSANGAPQHIPTAAKEVFDVSGAGDTVLAALAAALAGGAPLVQAIRHANLAAGVAVAKFGTATVSQAEILRVQDKADAASP